MFGLNVRAAYFLAQAVARRLIDAKKSGSIINMSSQMGHVGGPTRTVYCATKHAMEGFTKAMAIELAPYKIRVNTLAPTFIETPMTRPFFQNEAFRTDTLNRIKLGRLGQLEDLTGARVSVAATGWQRRGDGADSRRRFSFFVFCRRQPVVTLSGLDADRAAELPGRSRWPPGPPICRHARAAVRARERNSASFERVVFATALRFGRRRSLLLRQLRDRIVARARAKPHAASLRLPAPNRYIPTCVSLTNSVLG